jgi:hypothetical protein
MMKLIPFHKKSILKVRTLNTNWIYASPRMDGIVLGLQFGEIVALSTIALSIPTNRSN